MKLDEILRHGGYRRGWGATGGLLVCLLCALSLSARAGAGTITVTTALDQLDAAAPCSLREAVETANADADSGGCIDANPAAADTIKLAANDYNLRRAGVEDANASGDLDVTETLTIAGDDADESGIDGNAAITGDRVLHLSAGTLTVSGLSVHDGRGSLGGGIAAQAGTTLKLTNGTVSDNSAISGGGISGDTVTLTNSTVRNNSGLVVGGGIYATGTATLTGSALSGNTLRGDSVRGGGILANTAKLTNSTVTANRALAVEPSSSQQGFGGGINAVIVTLTDSTVSGNEATTDVGGSSNGGGIVGTTATLTRTTVSNNNVSGFGGGISATTAKLTDSTVSDNDAGAGGGGIEGAGTLTDSSVRRNTAGAEGGGIYSQAGALTLTRSTVADNDATNNGGGIFYTSPGTLSVINSTLSHNESNGWGGALSTDEGTTNLKNATISRNVADADANGVGDGGGLDGFGGTVNLRNTILAGNLDPSAPVEPDWHCSGGFVSQGYNLLSSTAGCAVAPATGDQTASDPGLAFLANNGGRTLTLALLSNSPAVNSGNPATSGSGACPATDQRGVPRSLGGRCDKGAYERVSCRGKLVNRVGTEGADLIVGTSAADGILGLGGPDILRGGSAGDGLCGQDGNDQLFGEAGPDFLDGGGSTDTCDGGTETDQAVGCETITLIP